MKRIVFMLAVLLLALTANAQKERKHIRESYKLYNDSNYAGAQEAAVKALAEAPNSYEAAYDYAEALFKQQKVDEALEQYNRLASAETDKARLSKLYHNIGNCHYAKQDYNGSIEAYKKSLRADPSNDMTRYNLVAAQKMKDQQQQNQNQNKQQQQQQQQEQQQQQQEQQQQEQQQQEQQQQQEEMNREEAERLLEALQQDEDKLQEKRKKIKDAQPVRIEKNW